MSSTSFKNNYVRIKMLTEKKKYTILMTALNYYTIKMMAIYTQLLHPKIQIWTEIHKCNTTLMILTVITRSQWLGTQIPYYITIFLYYINCETKKKET